MFDPRKSTSSAAGYKLSDIELAWFLISHPSWIRYFGEWQRSVKMKLRNPSANTLEIGIPWLTYDAISWVRKYLKPDMRVFEYGSGGSTIYIASRVRELVSVEHNREWFDLVRHVIQDRGITNSTYMLVEPEKRTADAVEKYSSTTFDEYKGFDFERYVRTINNFPDNYFDLIIVDGRARSACVKESATKIRDGGYLILDNSERDQYQEAFDFMQKYSRMDFFGFGPFLKTFWNTTIWKVTSSP